MFGSIFVKELLRNLKSVSFYVFTGLLFFGVFMFAQNTDPNTEIIIFIGSEWHNAPLVIARLFAMLCVFGVLFTMVIVGRAVARDFDAKIHDFFFTTPISKTAYLGGRFLGSLSANILIYIGVILGLIAGCLSIESKYSGPFSFSGFLIPILVVLVPNLLLIGSILFSVAALTRKMVLTYMFSILFLMIYGGISIGLSFLEDSPIRILADPFGIAGLAQLTKNWTLSDINLNPIPLNSTFLLNRLIWISVSIAVLGFTWKKFRFVSILEGKEKKSLPAIPAESELETLPPIIKAKLDHSPRFQLQKCLHVVLRETKKIILHPAFLVLTFLSMANIVLNFVFSVDTVGNKNYPLTSIFLRYTNLLWVYLIPLTILFGGMIVWKERDYKSNAFYDSYPLPGWMSFSSKLLTMMSIQFFYVVMIMLSGIITQIALGWTDIELVLYIKILFGVHLLVYWHIALVVLTIQNLVKNKYLGFFISAAYFVFDLFLFDIAGFDNILLRYGRTPGFTYSNMNGFGHYAQLIGWYTLYWLLFAGILIILNSLLWRKNEETRLKFRFRVAKQNFKRIHAVSIGVLVTLFLITGVYIYINRYVLNHNFTEADYYKMCADYEKKYQQYQDTPQPEMTHVSLEVDFYPQSRDVFIKGHYALKNNTDEPIDTIFINLPEYKITEVNHLGFSVPAEQTFKGEEFGFRAFKLSKPLVPGDEIKLEFDLEAVTRGFTDNNPRDELAKNGSRLHLSVYEPTEYFPTVGYKKMFELANERERKKQGLPKQPVLPPLEQVDTSKNLFGTSYITYDAVVSTGNSQTAITNGNLVKQWTDKGRNYFHYRSQTPMQNEVVLLSGEYKIKKALHNGITLAVYYFHKHHWNIDRIIKGTRVALDYCSKNFIPYPFQSLRVVEIPDYMTFGGARAQPSLIIWREGAGFIRNIRETTGLDILLATTAHEIAHNWWPIVVTPAFSEGMALLAEAIAQYVSVMCLEKEYGKPMVRRLLKEQMTSYLSRRKEDMIGERPMTRHYPWQTYLTYEKSLLAMYALQDAIGEDRVNLALKNILHQYQYNHNIFPTPLDLVKAFREVTSPGLKHVITDLFETITLYDNRAVSAFAEQQENGKYKVKLKIFSRKLRADSQGKETEIPVNDYMYIVVLDKNGQELYLKKHKINRQEMEIEIIVNKEPAKAGIDPFFILIDRDRDNNLVKINFDT
jgi:ABC-type transport system involved in multi-copper enzyme maturation permease subunit